MAQPTHEQLASGVANAVGESDDSAVTTVRINPIPEGEITVGQSGEETVWDRDPLEAAVDAGALDGATIVKGEGGTNPHFPMDEQVPPENILGRVDSWDYEAGVGPVGKADLVDEQMASRIDHDLLEVSPDLKRRLGEHDEERGATTVDEIVAMPRLTVLETGASEGASIEPATAEALGFNPDGERQIGPDGEQLAPLYTLRFRAFGEFVGDEFVDEAVSALDAISGVTAVRNQGSEDPELVAVLDRDGLNLDELNQSITDALDGTPFELFEDWDWLDHINTEQLAQAGDAVAVGPGTVDSIDASLSDELAESSTGPADSTTSDMTEDDGKTKAELREQLAAAKAENAQLESENESLETEIDSLESEVEDKEATIDDKEATISEQEDAIDRLEAENEPARQMLARRAARDSALSADAIEESDMSNQTLADNIVDAEDLADEDDDRDPMEILTEQMAAPPSTRGEQTDESPSGDDLTEEQLAAANDRAYEVIDGQDVQTVAAEDITPREFATQKTGVDPADCDSRSEFARRVDANGEGGEN